MPKCDFNSVALQLYQNHSSAWVLSCKFAAYFENTFSWEHLWVVAFEYLIKPQVSINISHKSGTPWNLTGFVL